MLTATSSTLFWQQKIKKERKLQSTGLPTLSDTTDSGLGDLGFGGSGVGSFSGATASTTVSGSFSTASGSFFFALPLPFLPFSAAFLPAAGLAAPFLALGLPVDIFYTRILSVWTIIVLSNRNMTNPKLFDRK